MSEPAADGPALAVAPLPAAPAVLATPNPPIVLFHGMWSTPATFTGLRRSLEAAGYTTHAPALPLHDRTRDLPPPPELAALRFDDYVAFLAAEIARLPGPVIVGGHSMGGSLAQAVAARVGAAGLMLFAPGPTAATSMPSLSLLLGFLGIVTRPRWWDRPTLIDAARARSRIYNGVPDEVALAEIAALVWDSGRVLLDMALPFVAKSPSFAVDYAKLTMPALVVVGDHDRITPAGIARATARRLAQVDYHELPKIGHWLWWGDVEARVAGLATAWLAEHFPPTKWEAST